VEVSGSSSAQPTPSGSSSAQRVSRPRRTRGVTEALLTIVLGLEAFLMFFVTLVVFGLRIVDPVVAFAGGGALLLILVVVAGLQRHRAGVIAGAVLQVVLIATGFVFPVLFALGAVFAGIWLWAFLRARAIEKARAEYLATHPEFPTSEGDPT
tara:strand:+ start:11815 stop:12273 length:459 start_codon:yes stop_codon:yes gene_type:complete